MSYRVARMVASGHLSYVARPDVLSGETFLVGYAATFSSREVADTLAATLGNGFAVVEVCA